MASSKEVLKDWLNEGKYVPQEEIDSLYGMQALTNDLAEKRFLDKYGKYLPWSKAEQIQDPAIPTLDVILDYIPKKDGDKRTKYEIFLQDFPKKAPEWKKKFTKDPSWGERGWNTVYDVWKKVSNWQMQDDIRKARKNAVNEVGKPWYNPSRLYGMYASLMLPRAWEHLENEGDFTGKDIAADLGVNSAMAIPGSALTGLGAKAFTKVAPKVAPKVLEYFASPGRNIAEGVLKGAGRMSGNIAGNAVVPFASEGLDAAIYDENDPGMEQRADFSLGDAVLGTAINQGVNRGLMRMAGPIIDRFSANGMARGGMAKARAVLERLGLPFSQKGDDFAQSVANKLNAPIVNKGEITQEALNAARLGQDVNLSTQGINEELLKQAIADQAVLDAIKLGNVKLAPKSSINQAVADIKKKADDADLDYVLDAKGERLGNVANYLRVLNDVGIPVKEVFTLPKTLDIYGKPGDRGAFLFRDAVPEDNIPEIIARNAPEMVNYATWHGEGPQTATRAEKILNVLNQAAPAWGINKWGSETDANLILGPMPTVKKALNENRKKVQQAPKDRQASADVLKVIGNGGLTAEDQKYLNAIARNPEIMRIGYKEDPNGFKMWLLERGNDLLAGTRAARPTFGVE